VARVRSRCDRWARRAATRADPVGTANGAALRRSQDQRERLLRAGVDASDAERRRIAGNLHDGVVQDLTGVSYALSAASRRGDHSRAVAVLGTGDDDAIADAAKRIRVSVKSLRSLLVEIYPPSLTEEGLESALGELLARVEARGVHTTLTVAVDDRSLPPDAAALLYRAARTRAVPQRGRRRRSRRSHLRQRHLSLASTT
jgi:two-component system, NarL family, sensor kinase